jgi:CDP-paratose 2-epimerase
MITLKKLKCNWWFDSNQIKCFEIKPMKQKSMEDTYFKRIVKNQHYNIFGYKGKQVRDNIHSWDLVNMFWHYHQNPRPGEVYNAGGGRKNSTSILEAIDTVNRILREKNPEHQDWNDFTLIEENRIGDHIWYITDLSKFHEHYPEWPGITISLEETIRQMVDFELGK